VESSEPAAELSGEAPAVNIAKRSDRRKPGSTTPNPWAWASLVCALLGLGAVAVITAGAVDARILRPVPDWAGSVLYGAVPSLGVLAVAAGFIGRGRGRHRWVAWTGLAVGCVLGAIGLAAVAVLLNAFRTAG
jgi:hypothetical protein